MVDPVSISIDDVRHDTPGVANVTHLNNAGAALPPRVVTDVVISHLEKEAAFGGYEAAADASEALDDVYRSVGRLIGADPREIALVENATRAWDMAVYGFPFQNGDRVITARSEYASNAIALLQLQRRHDLEIVPIEDDEHGQIDLDALDRELDRGAAMVSLTHVPTNGGLINPAAEVGATCRRHGVCFVLDACQSAGQLPLDVAELGCDVLSATGRKYLRGPRGTGFLYVRTPWIDRLEPPLLDLHAAEWVDASSYRVREDARRFETWESNVAARLGLGAAADYALQVGIADGWERIHALATELRARLSDIPSVTIHDKGATRGGIVTFTTAARGAQAMHDLLSSASINTSVTTPSHSQLDGRGLEAMVRASVHYYNTDVELERLVEVVAAG